MFWHATICSSSTRPPVSEFANREAHADRTLLATTLVAMVTKVRDFWRAGETPLLVVGSLLIVLATWLVVEAVLRLRARS